ncbi:MAG TPA: heme-binding protein [Candidatus Polarisedimenticolia bacterium]|nr:heme-binding protein [Dongiaceae bacterium]HYV88379.1 heme-binding protein [Candidatus Polarisedimenticolia bacterium]
MKRALFIAACASLIAVTFPAGAQSQLITTHRIPAALALEAVGQAVATCAQRGFFETAVLVDADGVRQALLRGDGSGPHSLDSAFAKAYTSATMRANTEAVVERSKTDPIVINIITKMPNMLLDGGGVVIRIKGEVIGAIAASGAPDGKVDEACAQAGLDKIIDRLQ